LKNLKEAYRQQGGRKHITQHTQLEEKLGEGEMYRTIVENASDQIYMIDADDKLLYVNKAAAMVSKRRPEEMVGKSIFDLFPNEIAAVFSRNLKKVFRTGERIDRDEPMIAGGKEMWISTGLVPMKNPEGKVEAVMGISRDITERRQREEELRQLHEYLQLQVDRMPVALIVWSPEFCVQTWNPAAEKIFGFTAEEAMGKHPYDIIVPREAQPHVDKIWGRLLEGDMTAHSVNENVTKVGRTIICQWSNTPLRKADGTVIGVLSMVQDITERKRLEEERTKAQAEAVAGALASRVIDGMMDMVVTTDLEGKITGFNKAFGSLGWGEEAKGKLPTAFVVETDAPRVREAMKTSVEKRPLLNFECTMRAKDGREIPVLVNATLLRDLEGKPTGRVAAIRDVTEPKKMQDELRKKTEELDRYFTSNLDLLCIADTDGYFRRLNPEWEKTLGYSIRELEGQRFMEFVHPDDVNSTSEALASLSSQKEVLNFVNRYRCKDGTYRWIEWRSYPAGNLIYAAARDMTEHRRLEKTLRQTLSELQRSNTELEQFAYVASHDLQEPLRMVASYVQLLERRYKAKLDSDADEFIAYAVDGASRMQNLINDLLAYSRVGTRSKPFMPTNFESALNEALTNLGMAIEESGAAVTRDPLPTLNADASQMVQVFQNLIGNAAKFRGNEPPRIHVSAEKKENDWIFSVRDNGIGIDPEYFNRIFGVFQRLHGRDKYPGTGIGLAVCKKIVERHGGRIWVESQLAKGATFYFTIPVNGGERA
jgi:PAS domain S-box-containing protein